MARPATAAVRLLTGEREPCRLATTANIDVDTGGLLVIDGVQTEVGDRILVKDQADGSENSIRTASEGQWYRAADARSARTLQKGTTVTIQEGTVNANKVFRFETIDPVIGDDALVVVDTYQDIVDDLNATPKATPVDADRVFGGDSAASFGLVYATWAQIKSFLFASSALTGTPTAPTAAPGTNTTQIATTGFVKAAIDVILGGVSSAFDTLAEIATDLGLKMIKTANLSDVSDKPSARGNLVVPTFCTQAQLPGLDTTKDKLAFVTDFGFESWYRWQGTDLSTRTVLQSVTSTAVNSGTDTITKVAHGLSTASGVVPTTTINGVTANTVYYAIKVDADNFKLASTLANALAGTAVDLTGTTNFTAKQLFDPAQKIYVIPTSGQLDGTGGAWIRQDGGLNFGISGVNYKRFSDRMLVGKGATRWLGDSTGVGTTGAGSWLNDEVAPGSSFAMSYLLYGAQIASVCDPTPGQPNLGVLGAARTPDGSSGQVGYGGASFASGHSNGGGSIVWGHYFEAVQRPGSDTTVNGVEIEATKLDSTVRTFATPDAGYVQGRVFGILLASGGGNVAPYDADWGMFVNNNGAKFRTGIIFGRNGLTKDAGTNYQHAILMPDKARVEWYTSDTLGNVGFAIHSEISSAANAQFIKAVDGNLFLNNNNGGLGFRVQMNTSAAGNYVSLNAANPSSGPTVQALGGDTNIDLNLATTGTGVVKSSAAIVSTGAGGIGYATGAGGTVTQATSRTTGVTLNKVSGAVTMFTAAGSATPASFTVTNSTVAATDTITLNIKSGATNTYFYFVTAVAAGSFVVTFWTTGGTASDTPVLNFNVIKGVAS